MILSNYFYSIIIICLHTVKWFQVTYNNPLKTIIAASKYYYKQITVFIVSSIPIKYESFLNRSIWPIDKTLKGSPTPGQSGPGSNGNEEVLYTSIAPGLEPHPQMQFSAIPWISLSIWGGGLCYPYAGRI